MTDDWMITSEDENLYTSDMNKEFKNEFGNLTTIIGDTCVSDCIDKIMGIQIPIISTVSTLYKTGHSLTSAFNLRKMAVFINNSNNSTSDDERNKYLKDYEQNKRKYDEQISYLIMILERYTNLRKAKFLSKIYLAFLRNKITWIEVCKYGETIDRFLPGDYDMLKKSAEYSTLYDRETDTIQRLISLGLVIEEIRKSNVKHKEGTVIIDDPEDMEKKERNYVRTEYGSKLVDILENEDNV